MKARVLLVLMLMLPVVLRAQEEADSLVVFGTVSNYHGGEPMKHCHVLLTLDGDTVATALTDDEGLFALPPIAVGRYTLSVSRRYALYKADLILNENISLNIMVDTMQRITLQSVDIEAEHHLLDQQGLLITDPDDSRLWNMSGQIFLTGPASADFSGGKLNNKPRIGRTFKVAKQWQKMRKSGFAVRTPWDMQYPDIVHPAPADTTKTTSSK